RCPRTRDPARRSRATGIASPAGCSGAARDAVAGRVRCRGMSLFDPRLVARSFGAASAGYDAAAALQTLVREELLSRLVLLPAPPRALLDLGAGTGLAAASIKRRYPRATVTAADIALPMLQQA